MKRFVIHWKGFCKDSAFDWHVCLSCFAIGLVLVVLADSYLYLTLSRAESETVVVSRVPTVTLNRQDIETTATKLRSLDATPHTVPSSVLRDPSL